MYKIIFHHLFLLLALFHTSFSQRRIKDGKEVESDKGYMVYLLNAPSAPVRYRGWLCGGAIITKDYVITSAACVADVQHIYVVPGYRKYVSSEKLNEDECVATKKKKVVLTCIPKGYQFEYNRTEVWSKIDIALVKVESSFDFNDKTYEKVCSYMPKSIEFNTEKDFPKTGDDVYVLGWGHTKKFRKDEDLKNLNQEKLQYAATRILDENICVTYFQDNKELASFIAQSMLCTLEAGNIDEKGELILRSPPNVQGCITQKEKLQGAIGKMCDGNIQEFYEDMSEKHTFDGETGDIVDFNDLRRQMKAGSTVLVPKATNTTLKKKVDKTTLKDKAESNTLKTKLENTKSKIVLKSISSKGKAEKNILKDKLKSPVSEGQNITFESRTKNSTNSTLVSKLKKKGRKTTVTEKITMKKITTTAKKTTKAKKTKAIKSTTTTKKTTPTKTTTTTNTPTEITTSEETATPAENIKPVEISTVVSERQGPDGNEIEEPNVSDGKPIDLEETTAPDGDPIGLEETTAPDGDPIGLEGTTASDGNTPGLKETTASDGDTPGICQNDHGGPLIAWRGGQEVVVGVATLFRVNKKQECRGPYLFTKTWCNSAFLDCIISQTPASNKTRRNCNNPAAMGFEIVRRHISWVGHSDGPADNERIQIRHQVPIMSFHP